MIDKEMLLSASLSDKVSEIGNLFFNYNRVLDAGMDYLEIEFGMKQMANFIHETLAHVAPLDADHFRDFNAKNMSRTNYGLPIEGNNAEYDSPFEFFVYAFSYSMKILRAIKEGISLAETEGNIEACGFFKSQISVILKYKYQFVLLHDRCESAINMGNTWIDVDSMWRDFVVA